MPRQTALSSAHRQTSSATRCCRRRPRWWPPRRPGAWPRQRVKGVVTPQVPRRERSIAAQPPAHRVGHGVHVAPGALHCRLGPGSGAKRGVGCFGWTHPACAPPLRQPPPRVRALTWCRPPRSLGSMKGAKARPAGARPAAASQRRAGSVAVAAAAAAAHNRVPEFNTKVFTKEAVSIAGETECVHPPDTRPLARGWGLQLGAPPHEPYAPPPNAVVPRLTSGLLAGTSSAAAATSSTSCPRRGPTSRAWA